MLLITFNEFDYNKPVGVFTARLRPQLRTPQFRTPQFRMLTSFDRCMPPRRRFNQNIPPSVVQLQQCHCRNGLGANFKIYLLRQFCSNRVQFLQRAQCSHLRAMLALQALYYLRQFRPSVRHTPVLCQNDGTYHGAVCKLDSKMCLVL